MHDVIVVGGGPAGLYAALTLVREGFDVVVLEEHPAIGSPTHCTGIISTEIEELYKVPDSVILHDPKLCRVVAPSGATYEFTPNGEGILVIDRAAFDRSLATLAHEAGVTIRQGCRVAGIVSHPWGVEASTESDETVKARVAVLACGVTYRFHRQLRWGLPSHFLHSAQVEVDAEETEPVEVYFGRATAPEGFAWIVPVRRGERWRLKIGVLARGDASGLLEQMLQRPVIAQRLTSDPEAPIRRLMPLGPLTKTFGERLLAIGDAAGLTKPTTGGGIFYSFLSAALAVETIREAFRLGKFGEGQFSRYEARWQTRLGPELKAASRFRRLLARLSDTEIETVLEAVASADGQEVIHQKGRFNWHRTLIFSILQLPGLRSLLLRSFLR